MSDKAKIASHTYKIKGGPGKDILFDALEYTHDNNAHAPIDFNIVLGYTKEIGAPGCAYQIAKIKDLHLTSIECENNSEELLNLKGHCKANLRITLPKDKKIGYLSYRFEAHYNAKTREGRVRLIEN